MKKFVLITYLGVLFAGCDTDELDFDNVKVQNIQGEYVFPVGEVTYTMRELIENLEDDELDLLEDSTSLLFLQYQDEINYQVQDDFISIGDIINNDNVDLTTRAAPAAPVAGPGVVTITESFDDFEYNPQNGEDIDSLFYAAGDVTVNINTTLPGTLDYQFTLNNTVRVDNSAPLVLNGTIVGGGNGTATENLAAYKTILPDVGVNNTFSVDFSATLTLGGADNFNGAETLTFDLTFANQTFSIIYGKFGQDTVQVGNEILELDFFDQSGNGIFFGNPTITFDFQNTFGVPIGTDFSTVFSDRGAGTAQTFIEGPITEAPLPEINPGIVAHTPPNFNPETVQTIIEINSGNSNISDFFSISPTRIGFDVTGISNPVDPDASNFLVPNSELSGAIEVTIPMEIRLENFEYSDGLSLGGGLDVTNIDSGFMRVVTVNELPFSGLLKLDVQDADSNSLYVVTDNLVLNAPFININGEVTDPNGVSADIPISPAGVEALAVGSHVLFTATLNTPGSLNSRDIFVKVLADYRIQVKIGVGGTVDLEIK